MAHLALMEKSSQPVDNDSVFGKTDGERNTLGMSLKEIFFDKLNAKYGGNTRQVELMTVLRRLQEKRKNVEEEEEKAKSNLNRPQERRKNVGEERSQESVLKRLQQHERRKSVEEDKSQWKRQQQQQKERRKNAEDEKPQERRKSAGGAEERCREREWSAVCDLEAVHVRGVYDTIAPHIQDLKQRTWPRVKDFLKSLQPGALVADVGCGNGRYLHINQSVFKVGSDVCLPFLSSASLKGHEVVSADNLQLPYRDGVFDAAVSVGVIHHFATQARRVTALQELTRILRPGGRLMVYVWAFEQKYRKFDSQDILVPWHKPRKSESSRRRSRLSSLSDFDRLSTSSTGSSVSDEEMSACPACQLHALTTLPLPGGRVVSLADPRPESQPSSDNKELGSSSSDIHTTTSKQLGSLSPSVTTSTNNNNHHHHHHHQRPYGQSRDEGAAQESSVTKEASQVSAGVKTGCSAGERLPRCRRRGSRQCHWQQQVSRGQALIRECQKVESFLSSLSKAPWEEEGSAEVTELSTPSSISLSSSQSVSKDVKSSLELNSLSKHLKLSSEFLEDESAGTNKSSPLDDDVFLAAHEKDETGFSSAEAPTYPPTASGTAKNGTCHRQGCDASDGWPWKGSLLQHLKGLIGDNADSKDPVSSQESHHTQTGDLKADRRRQEDTGDPDAGRGDLTAGCRRDKNINTACQHTLHSAGRGDLTAGCRRDKNINTACQHTLHSAGRGDLTAGCRRNKNINTACQHTLHSAGHGDLTAGCRRDKNINTACQRTVHSAEPKAPVSSPGSDHGIDNGPSGTVWSSLGPSGGDGCMLGGGQWETGQWSLLANSQDQTGQDPDGSFCVVELPGLADHAALTHPPPPRTDNDHHDNHHHDNDLDSSPIGVLNRLKEGFRNVFSRSLSPNRKHSASCFVPCLSQSIPHSEHFQIREFPQSSLPLTAGSKDNLLLGKDDSLLVAGESQDVCSAGFEVDAPSSIDITPGEASSKDITAEEDLSPSVLARTHNCLEGQTGTRTHPTFKPTHPTSKPYQHSNFDTNGISVDSPGQEVSDCCDSVADNVEAPGPERGSGVNTDLCRFYHVFRQGELLDLVRQHVTGVKVIDSFYDHANWGLILEKV